MPEAAPEATSALARFAADLDSGTIPPRVVERVKLLLLDAIASALTGWTSPETQRVAGIATDVLGEGPSVVIGAAPASPGGAALLNGYLVTARSFCDVHQPTLCHVTPVTVPPVLAAAQLAPTDGAGLLAGLAAAMEATVRVGQALDYPVFRSRGWHTPGVAGPVGGALGAARVLGMDAAGAESAAGIGGSQAAGTFASFGTPTIKLHQAHAAWAGLVAAVAARHGLTGPPGILTAADGGLLGTFSDGGDPAAVTAGLGEVWQLEGITTRLWPTAAALQAVLSMVLADDQDLPAADGIRQVDVGLPRASHAMNATMGWETPFAAALSARYVTAVALSERRMGVEELSPGRVAAPPPLVERVDVHLDTSLPEGGATLRIATFDGGSRELRRDHPRGDPRDPASWDEVADKLVAGAAGVLDPGRARQVIETVAHLEDLPDAGNLIGPLSA